ncbi:MAG: T9SS type A sorting domain-containing protein [Fidelibacterota bacterium]
MKMLTIYLLLPFALFAQTSLGAGDVALLGVNCDNPDDFAFLLLKDITAGTVLKFTDDGWLSTGSFRGSEGTKIYTASADVSAGNVIVYSTSSDFTSSGSFALSASGDQIIVYQGDAESPTMITALNLEGAAVWQTTATNANTSALPTGLTNGTNAIALTEYDNAKFNGSTSYDSPAAARAAICDNSNWSESNSTSYNFTTFGDFSLPVELGYFEGQFIDRKILLTWVTESETDNTGFILYRAVSDGPLMEWENYRKNSSLRGQGSVSHRTEYRYTDNRINLGETYTYVLAGIDYAGRETVLGHVTVSALPDQPLVKASYPNPFNPRTTLEYFLLEPDMVTISILNVLGQQIKTVRRIHESGGNYRFVWSGENGVGKPLPSGVYFILFQCRATKQVQKIILSR